MKKVNHTQTDDVLQLAIQRVTPDPQLQNVLHRFFECRSTMKDWPQNIKRAGIVGVKVEALMLSIENLIAIKLKE